MTSRMRDSRGKGAIGASQARKREPCAFAHPTGRRVKRDYCGFRFNDFASSAIETDSALTNVWNSSAHHHWIDALVGEHHGHEWSSPAIAATSPNSKGIVNVVVRIIPDRGEGRLTHAGGTSRRSILLTHANEIDEIFDLSNSISR